MKSNLLYSFFFIAVFIQLGNAQVGIGTTTPNAQFDIRSSNQATPSNTDGVLIPKIDVFPATNPTAAQQGMLVYLTTATTFGGNPKPIGFYYWNNSPADWIGISSAANGDHDWYEEGTTTPPNAITDEMFHTGNVAIGKNTADYPLDVVGTNLNATLNVSTTNNINEVFNPNRGIYNAYTGTSTDDVDLAYNFYNGSSTGVVTGTSNNIFSSNTTSYSGTYNYIFGNQGVHLGVFNNLGDGTSNTGVRNMMLNRTTSSIREGILNEIYNNNGIGYTYGVHNTLGNDNSGTTSHVWGLNNSIIGTGNSPQYGVSTYVTNSGTGSHFGVYNQLDGSGNSLVNSHYGVYNTLSGAGVTSKYGTYNFISSTAGGNHYGVYSSVLKPGITNFAGYFLGNVSIGTTTLNNYIFPASRGTNGQVMRTDGLGNITWQNPSSFAWLTTGNSGTNGGNTTTAGTNFIGTTDNQNLDVRTNNIYRARFSNLGEFFVGALNTVITGDLMNGVSNATFPWAINGYSDQNGAGVYGQVTAGTTIFAGVQGEYNGSNAQGAGVRGIALTSTAGTSFGATHTGVTGTATTSGSYKFGVYGSGGTSARTGGVMGYDYGAGIGALGYYSSAFTDYSVYGFGLAYQTGVAAGRFSSANHTNFSGKNTNIGLGIYGGVMGGWVRGMKYGFHAKGETYSLYVDGNAYTNKPLTYLIESDDNQRVASYMTTSIKPEVTINGKTALQNGRVFVAFDKNFSKVISNLEDIVITATPQGKSNGVYIDDISRDGFWIIENNDGVSNVKISWIAITQIKGEENPVVPSDLLAEDFDKKMDKVMFNDNNTTEEAQSLWWDGTKIRWDRPTNDKRDTTTQTLERPKDVKK